MESVFLFILCQILVSIPTARESLVDNSSQIFYMGWWFNLFTINSDVNVPMLSLSSGFFLYAIGLFWCLKIRILVLLAFNDILLVFNHLHKYFRSWFTLNFFDAWIWYQKISIVCKMVNCTKFDSIMQVIYIDKEKEWTKDRSLWDSIFHISSFRGISIKVNWVLPER